MKKTLIGVVAVLATGSMAFGVLSLEMSDITLNPGETGYVYATVHGTDLTSGLNMYFYSRELLITGITPLLTPLWPQNIYTDTMDDVWWSVIGSLNDDPASADGYTCVKLTITVPVGMPLGVYEVTPWTPEDHEWEYFASYYTDSATITSIDFYPLDVSYVTVVPEPVSALLLGLGGLFLRRRR